MSRQGGRARLIIVCGLPGVGKTTLARQLEQRLGAVRLCPDEWMEALAIDLWDEVRRSKVEALQWKVGQRLLALGQIVVIEWGTWGRSEREALRVRARGLGAAVELRYLAAEVDVLLERIARRGMESPAITREQMEGWAKAFEAPSAEEMGWYDEPLESL